jgi:helicase
MQVKELRGRIPKKLYQVLKERKICSLWSPQREAIKKGILAGENLVIASPTSSGKTLPAELACVKRIIEGKGKAIYVVPLRSLAMEKYHNFKERYAKLGIRVAISIGDLDSSDPWLGRYDFIVLTCEKMDSLIRHFAGWLSEIATLVIDEIHLLQDPKRGPTLEVLITRLRQIVPQAQLIALSATINNCDEIASWLGAKLVRSKFRPVKLYKGVYLREKIYFEGRKEEVKGSSLIPELRLIEDTLKKKKQAFVFLSTRKSAEAVAKRAREIVEKYLSGEEKEKLKKVAEEVLDALATPTKQCKLEYECIKKGIAFHHAGLLNSQRLAIERAFREGLVKIICCTPSLAYGVDLPAWRSIIRDLRRYSPIYGSAWIPVLEFHQFCGRAGRPKFDSFGQAIGIAKSEGEKEQIEEHYIYGEPEEIVSKLSLEPVLRMHLLALISSLVARSKPQLMEFFSRTFYAYQYKHLGEIEERIDEILERFQRYGFIQRKKEKLIATPLGKRIAELYIDPETGWYFICSLKKSRRRKRVREVAWLQMISKTFEMHPLLRMSSKDWTEIDAKLVKFCNFLLEKEPERLEPEHEDFIRSFKTALLFLDWINELGDDEILEKYRVAPGELRARLANADWLLYASSELARLLELRERRKELAKLRIRMKHGVKEELLPLVRLKGIGRVRARVLFNAGIKTLREIKKESYSKLSSLVGPKIAASVKEQVGQKVKRGLKRWVGG